MLVCTSDSPTSRASGGGTPTCWRQPMAQPFSAATGTVFIGADPRGSADESRSRSLPAVRDDALALLAQALDAERDDVAHLEVLRRLHAEPHAGRRAGGDDVARQQRHELADVRNQARRPEDHRARVAA